MQVYSIYKILCLTNDKVYIGYTGQEPNAYIREHFASAKRGVRKLLYDAIRKHGPENFTYEVICQTLAKDDAKHLERHFIAEYDSFCHNGKGYNLTFGGDGGDTSHSPVYQAGIKLRDISGPKNGNWGGFSEQHKINMGKARKGKMPKNYNDFILFAKGKKYIHNPSTNDEQQVDASHLAQWLDRGYVVGRLKIPCEYCGMLSGPSNMAKHQKTKCNKAAALTK